jgi:DNA-binding NtrC family response regulator
VYIPPLRERREDIPLLVEHLLATGSFNDDGKGGRRLERLPVHWEQALAAHSFCGNVRELINLVERAVAIPDVVPTLTTPQAEDFPTGGQKKISQEADGSNGIPLFRVEKERLINDFEYNYLSTLLRQSGGNLSQAARIAGLDRKHLRDLVRKHGLYEKA